MISSKRLWPAVQPLRLDGRILALLALVLSALLLYRRSVASLLDVWVGSSASYEHGPVLIAASGYFFYRRWLEVGPTLEPRPSYVSSALVALTSVAWLLATLVHVRVAHQLSLVLLICLLVTAILGFRNARWFIGPLALLLCTVPIGDPLVPYFQTMFAKVTVELLNLTGIPTVLEGTHIWVPAGTFDVKPGCSGINQLMVAVAAGALFSSMHRLRLSQAAWVLAGAVGVAFVTNTLRIYVTVLIGEFSGMQHYLVTEHWAPAWVLFGVGMAIFFVVAGRWTDAVVPAIGSMTAVPANPAGPTHNGVRVAPNAALTAVALAIGPAILATLPNDRLWDTSLSIVLPSDIGGWHAAPALPGSYRPTFHGPDVEVDRLYSDAEDRQVYVYLAAYAHQEQGKEAVYAGNDTDVARAWHILFRRTKELPDGSTVRETHLRSRIGGDKLVWQWYAVQGRAVSSGYMAKVLNAWGTLRGDPVVVAVVIATDLRGMVDASHAEASLTRFLHAARPALERAVVRGTPSRSLRKADDPTRPE